MKQIVKLLPNPTFHTTGHGAVYSATVEQDADNPAVPALLHMDFHKDPGETWPMVSEHILLEKGKVVNILTLVPRNKPQDPVTPADMDLEEEIIKNAERCFPDESGMVYGVLMIYIKQSNSGYSLPKKR